MWKKEWSACKDLTPIRYILYDGELVIKRIDEKDNKWYYKIWFFDFVTILLMDVFPDKK